MIHIFCFKCITIQGFNTLLYKNVKRNNFGIKSKKDTFTR